MKISFYTLGCKANQAETAAMEQLAAEAGWEVVPFGTPCDAAVVNTCTVTGTADKKSRAALRHARTFTPCGTVGACGCFAQREARRLADEGLADVAFGNRDHRAFLQAVMDRAAGASPLACAPEDVEFRPLPAAVLSGRTRALLKVQDGCERNCAYCIIPSVRGKNRCMSPEEAERQVRLAVADGAKEIVLTGIEVAAYRHGDTDFAALVGRVCAAAGESRVRLGSLEPRIVDEAFCGLAKYDNFCPHFHLSLQSGCDATLARMRRQYNSARYARAIADLRRAFPDACFTTDLVVGFPGETEEELEQSLCFAEQCRFLKVHVFPYSIRRGTPAATMPGQVPMREKAARSRAALARLSAVSAQVMEGFCGRVLPVLCEDSPAPGILRGYTPNYLPVEFAAGEDLHNREIPVRLIAVEGDHLRGEQV